MLDISDIDGAFEGEINPRQYVFFNKNLKTNIEADPSKQAIDIRRWINGKYHTDLTEVESEQLIRLRPNIKAEYRAAMLGQINQ